MFLKINLLIMSKFNLVFLYKVPIEEIILFKYLKLRKILR